MDEMRVLPRRIPKAGKTKTNALLFSSVNSAGHTAFFVQNNKQ
jgi:hypothetical protein